MVRMTAPPEVVAVEKAKVPPAISLPMVMLAKVGGGVVEVRRAAMPVKRLKVPL